MTGALDAIGTETDGGAAARKFRLAVCGKTSLNIKVRIGRLIEAAAHRNSGQGAMKRSNGRVLS